MVTDDTLEEERRSQRLQAHMAAIVKSSDDAIISKDLNGNITAWNEGASKIFGYEPEEAIGRPITILIPADRRQEEPAILDSIRRGERVDHYETIRVTKNGELLNVSVTISPILDESGQIVGASKIARNITKQKEIERELRRTKDRLEERVSERTEELTRANEALKQLDRYRSEFIATMSHELRTPLNSIIGFTEILKEGRAGPVNDKQVQYLGMAHGSARHLLNLINDLLDLSRIEAGKETVFIEPFDAAELITQAVESVQTATRAKNLEIKTQVSIANLIYSDRKKVLQILLNLLSNAVKFTDHGLITVEARDESGYLFVNVSDTGIGMTAEQSNALFKQFRRLENQGRRVYEGTGLGLYLCKKLAGLLAGEIWATSERGKGSTFSFKIPVKAANSLHVKTENTLS